MARSSERFRPLAWIRQASMALRERVALGFSQFWNRLSPPQLFVSSFAILILLGTLGLKVIPGLYTGASLSWLDALFTATSAVCVTGLTVVDTATVFTPLGQGFILVLIQIGGLGMVSFTSLIITALGGRLSLRQQTLSTSGSLEIAPHVDPRRLIWDVVRFTLIFELAGAILLYVLWVPRLGWSGAVWPAIFHSVSAFCNAGFSTFSNNLVPMHDSPATLFVIMILIITGGLGFLALEELYLFWNARRSGKYFRLSLHTRVVLATSGTLVLAGAAAFTWFEWENTLARMPIIDRISNGLVMSVTTRSGGFNTVDYAQVSDASNFISIIFMTIGGSPGGTAGGIKTTTFALIGVLAWSRFRGDVLASVWSRSLRKETTDRAVGLFVVSFAATTIGILALTITEKASADNFLMRMFEAVSAFNTVGLSMGQTTQLSPLGRVVVILLMFIGRVGPLSMAAALSRETPYGGRMRYAYEEVAVG